jgi:hypothetical protein
MKSKHLAERRGSAIVWALIGMGLVACEQVEPSPPPSVTRNRLVALLPGEGVADTGEVLGNCIDQQGPPVAAERAQYSISLIGSAAEAQQLLAGSSTLTFSFARGALKGDIRASVADSLVEKSNQLSIAIFADVETKRARIDPLQATFRLSPDNPRFGELCGSEAVSEVVYGGRLVAGLTFRFRTSTRKNEFRLAMQASVKKGALAKASISSELRRTTESFAGDIDLRINLWQDGGNAADLLTAVRGVSGSPDSAALSTFACSQTDPAACADVIEQVLAYLYSDKLVDSFRTNPAPIGFSTISWSKFPGRKAVEMPDVVKLARARLERITQDLLEVRSTLRSDRAFAVARPDVERQADINTTAVLMAIDRCYDQLQVIPPGDWSTESEWLYWQCYNAASDWGLGNLGYVPIDLSRFVGSTDYDLVRDFCREPPCGGVWSYLDQAIDTRVPATALWPTDMYETAIPGGFGRMKAFFNGITAIYLSADGNPSHFNAADAFVWIPPDRVVLNPGYGRAAVLRFTAPKPGRYEVAYSCEGEYEGDYAASTFELVKNGVTYTVFTTPGQHALSGESRTIDLLAGDQLDIRSRQVDGTRSHAFCGVSAQINFTSPP